MKKLVGGIVEVIDLTEKDHKIDCNLGVKSKQAKM